MNRFIKARNNCVKEYNKEVDQAFNEYYLLHYDNKDIYDQNEVIQQLSKIRKQLQDTSTSQVELQTWLEQLGTNSYLNRAIIDLLIKNKKHHQIESLDKIILGKLLQKDQEHIILFHLLDYLIETKNKLLSIQQVQTLIHIHRYHYNTLKQLVEYINCFKLQQLEKLLEGLLNEPYYENLKLLIIDTLITLQSSKAKQTTLIKRLRTLVTNEQNPQVFTDYFDYRQSDTKLTNTADTLTIVQTMFYGDPYTTGLGNSGGLGILLKSIGNQLAKNKNVNKIITLTVSKKWNFGWKLIEEAAPNHYIYRMPLNLDPNNPGDFATKQLVIKRTILKSMSFLGICPDIFHIRYLDNASLAVAEAARELKSTLIFTITPDPHRNLVEKTGALKNFTNDEALTLSNKIYVGDKLLCLAQGVLGIGGAKIKNELKQYFPQLRFSQENFLFRMIGEGIDTQTPYSNVDLKEKLCNQNLRHHITEENLERPTILNVGRLSQLKGQDQLLTAWGNSRLHQSYNLILIGGDSKNPTEEELEMLEFFDTYLEEHPDLKGYFVQLDALSNEKIRCLEKALLENRSYLPNIFISSSKKEEFGLSILEALCEGWLVFAPIKGGVRTYLKHGINGFLINTSSAKTMIQDIEKILYESGLTMEDYANICKKGHSTVISRYSIEKIALSILDFYKKVKETRKL
jgi:glycosyltransferase involved in cell wall biosynthesis